MQEIEIWPYEQVVYAQPGIRPGEWDAHRSLWFWDTNILPNLSQTTRPDVSQLKKKSRTNRMVVFTVPADHRVKLKESEKREKYLDLLGELRKTMRHGSDGNTNCNWCVRNNPQRIDKETEDLEIRGQVQTIQTTTLLISARILRRVLETWKDFLSLILADGKKTLRGDKNNIVCYIYKEKCSISITEQIYLIQDSAVLE